MSEPAGTLVRITAEHRHKGHLVTIEDFVSVEESEEDEPFYWASSQQGVNDVVLREGDFVVAYTAAEAAARKPPTASRIADRLSVLGDHEVVEVDESQVQGDTVICFGVTPDGLRISFVMTISQVTEVDF